MERKKSEIEYFNSMNINAPAGTKVKFHRRDKSDFSKNYFRRENESLQDGKVYTVLYTIIGGWHTDVFLSELPGKGFNSVCFEEVE